MTSAIISSAVTRCPNIRKAFLEQTSVHFPHAVHWSKFTEIMEVPAVIAFSEHARMQSPQLLQRVV